jgi:outer membrane protein assembly factor BamB
MNPRPFALTLALAACAVSPRPSPPPTPFAPATSWPSYQYAASHNAVLEGTLRTNWLARLGGRINGGLAVVNGAVYADGFDGDLYAIDERTGTTRWSAHAGNVLMSTPIVTRGGLVIVGSGKDGFLKPDDWHSQVWGRPQGDALYAFDARSGNLVWKFPTAGEDMPSPALDGDRLIFANGDAHAYALDAATAHQVWKVDLPGVATMASATIDHGIFFVSTCHNAPYFCETRAIQVRSGRTLWSNPIGGSDCTPAIENGLAFVNESSLNDKDFHTGGAVTVAAIGEFDGKTRWTHTFPAAPYTYIASSERQIAGTAAAGVLYQPIGNLDRVVAFDERNGKVLWTAHTAGNVKMSPVIKGDRVYFGDTEGVFYVVDRRSGRTLRTDSYLQPFSVSSPVIDGDTIFFADGTLVVATPLDAL